MRITLDFRKIKRLPEWLSILEVQMVLDRSQSTILRLMKTYNIKSVLKGRKRLINRDDLIQKLKKMDNVISEQ